MRLVTAKTDRELTVAIDSSGEPLLHPTFSTCGVWVETEQLSAIGKMLQTIRDVHSCQTPIHHTEIRRECGQASVAKNWLQLMLKSPNFPVQASAYVIPKEGFDLSYYGGSRSKAVNRFMKTALLGGMARLNRNGNRLGLTILLDGHLGIHAGTESTLEYLSDGAEYRSKNRSDIHCSLTEVKLQAVPRSPLAPMGSLERAKQDLVALADLIAGVARGVVEGSSTGTVREEFVKLLSARKHWAARSGWVASPLEVSVIKFPGGHPIPFEQFEFAAVN